ncbi:MAG TPA: hypothetical protein PLZ71_09320, partial [Flavobacterium alvei]|nr:hypothetical protein [Flavobacterium alvei]
KDYAIDQETYTQLDYSDKGLIKKTISDNKNKIFKKGSKTFEYYPDGSMKMEGEIYSYSDYYYENKVLNYWDENKTQTVTNGNGYYEEEYDGYYLKGKIKNGLKDSIWSEENKTNHSKSIFKYNNGKFVSGNSIDIDGDEFNYKAIGEKPNFSSPIYDLEKHITKNFKTLKNYASERIFLSFDVDETGKVSHPKIIRGRLEKDIEQKIISIINQFEGFKTGPLAKNPTQKKYLFPIETY